MRRLALSLAVSLLLALPSLAQRQPNPNSGAGSNAGGGESRETVASPSESGGGYSGGGYSGGGSASSGGGSREPSSSRDSGSAPSSGGSASGGSAGAPAGGGARTPAVSPRGDPSDRDFNSRSRGKPVEVAVPPGAPAAKVPPKSPAAHGTQAGGSQKASIVPVPGPPSNPCFGGGQVNGKCVSCGAGATLSSGQCFLCPSGGVNDGGVCHPACENGSSWNGAACVGAPLCPECGRRAAGPPPERFCSAEQQALERDDRQRRELEVQAASACLFDPVGATCQDLQRQLDRIRQEVDRNRLALDRCRHGL